jgi:hypothetical protein
MMLGVGGELPVSVFGVEQGLSQQSSDVLVRGGVGGR